MECNKEIHDSLLTMGESICYSCGLLLDKGNNTYQCCDNADISDIEVQSICTSCGLVLNSTFISEYIDYYKDSYRIYRKSIYHRSYHIQNTLNSICIDNKILMTSKQQNKICKIFNVIEPAIAKVNKDRKRMISTRFIIRQLFKLLGMPYGYIKISKSKKTLRFNTQYWNQILALKGDQIMAIINK